MLLLPEYKSLFAPKLGLAISFALSYQAPWDLAVQHKNLAVKDEHKTHLKSP